MKKKIELPLDEIKRKYLKGYSTKQLSLMYGVGQHIYYNPNESENSLIFLNS